MFPRWRFDKKQKYFATAWLRFGNRFVVPGLVTYPAVAQGLGAHRHQPSPCPPPTQPNSHPMLGSFPTSTLPGPTTDSAARTTHHQRTYSEGWLLFKIQVGAKQMQPGRCCGEQHAALVASWMLLHEGVGELSRVCHIGMYLCIVEFRWHRQCSIGGSSRRPSAQHHQGGAWITQPRPRKASSSADPSQILPCSARGGGGGLWLKQA